MPPQTLSIGQLARSADVAVSTVRYYERRGLLRPRARTSSGYRVYGPEDVARLRFIRAAQANGFTLDDMATLLGFRDGATADCRAVQRLIDARLGDIAVRKAELRHLERELRTSLRACRRTEREGRCIVVDELVDAASRTPAGSGRGKRKRGSRNPS